MVPTLFIRKSLFASVAQEFHLIFKQLPAGGRARSKRRLKNTKPWCGGGEGRDAMHSCAGKNSFSAKCVGLVRMHATIRLASPRSAHIMIIVPVKVQCMELNRKLQRCWLKSVTISQHNSPVDIPRHCYKQYICVCITVKTPPMRHADAELKSFFVYLLRAMAIKLVVSAGAFCLNGQPLVCSCWPKKLRCRKLLRCEPSKLMKFKWFISEENVRCCCLGPFTKGCWERRILMRWGECST